MVKQKVSGTEGLVLALILAAVLSAVNFFVGNPPHLEGNMGICLPSPNLWPIADLWSWAINLALLLIMGLALHISNKDFSPVQTTDTVLAAAFLIFAASNPWITGFLNTSIIMVIVNFIALNILFGCYRASNATQQLFVVATMLSFGSMFQYAFIFMIPAYICIAVMMKCLRFKGIIAFLMGLAAPYWIVVGLGIVPLSSFALPSLTNLSDGYTTTSDIFIGILNIGITAIMAVLMFLNNAVKLYAGNSRRRLVNNSIAVLGLISAISMCVDFNNLTAYLATFYLASAVQLSNTFELSNIPRSRVWFAVIALIYTVSFAAMIW